METDDVLADQMQVCRPLLLDTCSDAVAVRIVADHR